MKNKLLSTTLLAILLSCSNLKAQEIEDNVRMIKPFMADGISNEWNEPLNEYNTDTKLAFALANDDQNLYIIIESLDPQTTFSVLKGGITLNINTEGKKKKGIDLTFPLMERPQMPKESVSMDGNMEPHREREQMPKDLASTNKSIKVEGFKNIKDGDLPIINDSGIEAGMTIKPNRDLIYELRIPLTQLQIDVNNKKPLAYNIKINVPNRSNFKKEGEGGNSHQGAGNRGGAGGGHGGMGGGRSGGMGGGGSHGSRPGGAELANKVSDFWIKFKLAKA